jgi:ParB-like chromosome segregation protein Spo0J
MQDRHEFVRVDCIQADPEQPRKNKPQVYIKQLAQSIASEGLNNPVEIIPIGDGLFRLVNGECRTLAVSMFIKDFYTEDRKNFKIEDGEIYIYAKILAKNMTPGEIFLNQIMDNLVRLNMGRLETLEAIKRALTDPEVLMPMEKVSSAFGLSREIIEADLPILDLPNLMKKEWDEGRLPKVVARKIASLEPKQHDKAYEWAKSGRTAEVMLKKIDAYLEQANQMSLWAEIKDGADEKTRKACKVLYGQLVGQMEKFSKSPYTNGESKTFILCNKNRLSEIERTAKEMEKISKSILGALCEFRVKDKNAVA